ncbi:MAG TPA: J domain-containing protein [Candidatus Saccharimonadales bacterium]|nr:J domain-containing protein [Candidatus Saccharimonadales bacterium]
MDYKDYYKTLGVSRNSTQAEIKKAFRKLARQSHPDVKPGDKAAEQRFKDINEANEVLSDPTKRERYDELGANWAAYTQAAAGGQRDPFGAGGPFAGFAGRPAGKGGIRYEFRSSDGDDFSDFFRMFFGQEAGASADTARTTRRTTGTRGSGSGNQTIEDLFGGMGATSAAGSAGAQTRSGTGGRSGADPFAGIDINYVDGSGGGGGQQLPPAEAETELTLDEAFHGTTRLVEIDGRRIEVKVPAGVDTGNRIRIKGKGGGSGASARDLYIVPRVRAHHTFARKGPDLTREIKVTLREALLGGDIHVRTLKGRVLLTIPAGTQNGRTFRLAGQGMPRLKGEGSGDLYVRVNVVLPTNLSDESKEGAQRFLELVDQPDPRAGS